MDVFPLIVKIGKGRLMSDLLLEANWRNVTSVMDLNWACTVSTELASFVTRVKHP